MRVVNRTRVFNRARLIAYAHALVAAAWRGGGSGSGIDGGVAEGVAGDRPEGSGGSGIGEDPAEGLGYAVTKLRDFITFLKFYLYSRHISIV